MNLIVPGRRAVLEALRAGASGVSRVLIQSGTHGKILDEIRAAASARGVPVREAARDELDGLSGEAAHQGVVAEAEAAEAPASGLEEILARAREAGEPAFLVVLDELKDPGNLGAIVRTAEAAGAHGVIATERRTAPDGETVARASAGAVAHLPVTRVGNLRAALERLKAAGCWVLGADGSAATEHTAADFRRPVALVLGEEGRGLRELTRRTCDQLVRIPLRGRVESLNVSAAAAVLCFEVLRQRNALPREGIDP